MIFTKNMEEKKIYYVNKDKRNKNFNINMDDNSIQSKWNNSKNIKSAQKNEFMK